MLLDIKSFFEKTKAEIIYIPEIQRDYAQGRDSAIDIREALLDEIFDKALVGTTDVILNYIYGVPTQQKIGDSDLEAIILIDGQQRLTTLFLLEYYLSAKLGQDSLICKLKYATRETSMSFCDFLSKKGTKIIDSENGQQSPSSVLENDPAFRKKWLYDPTVSGMLNMLDAIAKRVGEISKEEVEKLYENLSKVKFSFISLDGFKRTEELYSAMNSRGKKLTKFEIHKGILLKVVNNDNELPGDINDNWVPAFWGWAKQIAIDSKENENCLEPEEFAALYHDEYLYNYFSFVVRMLWWERSEKAKEITKNTVSAIPDLEKMIEKIFNFNDDTGGANLRLLKFAMDKDFIDNFSKYDFKEKFSEGADFECHGSASNQEDFFKICCKEEELDNVVACYLWAYIKYQWDAKERSDCRLIDYLLVMRALVMSKIRGTVTGEDTPHFEKFMYNDVLKNFCKIVRGEGYQENEPYYAQHLVFVAENERKYSILNNKFIQGSAGNIVPLLKSKKEEKWRTFDENMKWIQKNAGKENEYSCGHVFRRLASCDLEHIDMRCKDATKVFLPATRNILNSIFSHWNWSETEDYHKLLSFLCTKKLDEIKDKNFKCSDWRYYVCKYETFREYYAQYVSDVDLQETDVPDFRMCLNAKYIDGVNATERQKRNPFVYELCCKAEKMVKDKIKNLCKEEENILKELYIKPFEAFKDGYGVTFKEENKDFVWTYTEEEKKKVCHCSGEKDIIEEFFDKCFCKVINKALQEYLKRSAEKEGLQG